MNQELLQDNEKLVTVFGASRIDEIKELPEFYTFQNKMIYSHRDFDKYIEALKTKKKCAIVSGFNASGTIHFGHKGVFDTNLFFQREFNVDVFIPISDDESYVTKKVKDQKEALKNSLRLTKELLAYGFNPDKTHIIIDQIYTNIYNFAIKLSRKITLSEIKATYGYNNDDNIGLHFYPAIQAAHILYPMEYFNYDHVLVPIGPDEDAHIRICRDLASRFEYEKPSIIHSCFLPGIDGQKMSKSKNNAIFFNDSLPIIKKKVFKAYSGGQKSIEEHRKLGGNPDEDIACLYLSKYFLNPEESKKLFQDYRDGKLLSGEVKSMLYEKLSELITEFKERLNKISIEDMKKVIMTNNRLLTDKMIEEILKE